MTRVPFTASIWRFALGQPSEDSLVQTFCKHPVTVGLVASPLVSTYGRHEPTPSPRPEPAHWTASVKPGAGSQPGASRPWFGSVAKGDLRDERVVWTTAEDLVVDSSLEGGLEGPRRDREVR